MLYHVLIADVILGYTYKQCHAVFSNGFVYERQAFYNRKVYAYVFRAKEKRHGSNP